MKSSLLAATLLALALSACGKKDEAAAAPAAPAPAQAAAPAPAANLSLPVADPAKPAEGIKPADVPASEQK